MSAGHLARVALRARARADPRAQAPRAVLVRLRAAGEVLDRPAHHLPPHAADPAVLRALRGIATVAPGGHGGPLGASPRRRNVPPGRRALARLRAARRAG